MLLKRPSKEVSDENKRTIYKKQILSCMVAHLVYIHLGTHSMKIKMLFWAQRKSKLQNAFYPFLPCIALISAIRLTDGAARILT